MLAEVGEERALRAEGRRTGEDVKAEVAALEPALAEVAPFREADGALWAGVFGAEPTEFPAFLSRVFGADCNFLPIG